MERSIAWIISSDKGLSEDLGNGLRDNLGCQVADFSPSEVNNGKQPRGFPQWVFVDLRSPDQSSTLVAQIRECRKLRAQPVPLIGIVDEGFPVASMISADLHLSSTLHWPCSPAGLAKVLQGATRAKRAEGCNGTPQCRSLQGRTVRLCTYEPALFPMLDKLELVAKHDFTVLLVGETGSGKTTLAQLIHELSDRNDRRLLTVGCGALPHELIDSELFGHIRGSFTGADKTKIGKFEAADDGTLLLDEIDVLDQVQQAKLLRVLETGEFEQVGSNVTHKANARTIVASNVDLQRLIDRGMFRPDLFFRLDQVKFELPPLRQRPRDIVPLATDFIEQCCSEHGLKVDRVDPDFLEILKAYHWPGNIREMRNAVRRATLFCRGGVLTPAELTPDIVQSARAALRKGERPEAESGLAVEVAQTEQVAIEQMLKTQNFNRAATARALGISRVTLYNKIRKYRINVDRPESSGDV